MCVYVCVCVCVCVFTHVSRDFLPGCMHIQYICINSHNLVSGVSDGPHTYLCTYACTLIQYVHTYVCTLVNLCSAKKSVVNEIRY